MQFSFPAWSSGSQQGLLLSHWLWDAGAVSPAQPGGHVGRYVQSPQCSAWTRLAEVITFTAKAPSCVANPRERRLSVGTGPGDRASCLADCPEDCVAPKSPTHNPSGSSGAALCLVWGANEIIAHVVMDADFLYSSLFPHVNIRCWLWPSCCERGERLYVSKN